MLGGFLHLPQSIASGTEDHQRDERPPTSSTPPATSPIVGPTRRTIRENGGLSSTSATLPTRMPPTTIGAVSSSRNGGGGRLGRGSGRSSRGGRSRTSGLLSGGGRFRSSGRGPDGGGGSEPAGSALWPIPVVRPWSGRRGPVPLTWAASPARTTAAAPPEPLLRQPLFDYRSERSEQLRVDVVVIGAGRPSRMTTRRVWKKWPNWSRRYCWTSSSGRWSVQCPDRRRPAVPSGSDCARASHPRCGPRARGRAPPRRRASGRRGRTAPCRPANRAWYRFGDESTHQTCDKGPPKAPGRTTRGSSKSLPSRRRRNRGCSSVGRVGARQLQTSAAL